MFRFSCCMFCNYDRCEQCNYHYKDGCVEDITDRICRKCIVGTICDKPCDVLSDMIKLKGFMEL